MYERRARRALGFKRGEKNSQKERILGQIIPGREEKEAADERQHIHGTDLSQLTTPVRRFAEKNPLGAQLLETGQRSPSPWC